MRAQHAALITLFGVVELPRVPARLEFRPDAEGQSSRPKRTGKLSSCFGARGDGTVVAGYEASPHRAWQPLERRTVRNPRRKRKPESRRACPRVGLGRM